MILIVSEFFTRFARSNLRMAILDTSAFRFAIRAMQGAGRSDVERTKWVLILSVFVASGCSGDGDTRAAGFLIETPGFLRQVLAVDPTQVSVSVTINDNAAISAQRVGDASWVVPGLRRSDYASTNSIEFVWTEQVGARPLLLAEFTGTFSVGTSASVDPVGQFVTGGEARFDIDNDGVSNLDERRSDPPTDPFGDGDMASPDVPEMVEIASGCFDMGSPVTEVSRGADEGPEFNVCVGSFNMSKFEVTFAEYDVFAQATQHSLPGDGGWGRGNRPVLNVSWNDAMAYATWLSGSSGRNFRLPTEAEWEYAALAGSDGIFHTGQTISSDQANFNATVSYNGSALGELRSQTLPVGSFAENAFGLHDMHGNVWEWTCSVYSSAYNGAEQTCGAGALFSERSIRGGGWNSSPANVRIANRSSDLPSLSFNTVGFRLAED